MEEHRYEYSGLRVAANFPLPEWAGFEAEYGWSDPDVRITLESEVLPVSDSEQPHMRVDRTEAFLQVPATGSYYICNGDTVRIRRAPRAQMREVRLFVLGFAWGALCYQRGLFPLHISAVEVDGGAMAFCGPSGAGKSSIAAWLNARGYPLLSDDLCRCGLGGSDSPQIWPSSARLKLWRDMVAVRGLSIDELERDHFRTDKFHLTALSRGGREPLPLRAIYLLDWGEWAIARLTGSAALSRVVAATVYRVQLIEGMGLVSEYWMQCAELVRRTPVWKFTRPHDLGMMDDAMARLIGHWRQTARP